MPSIICTLLTTMRPSSSTVSASAWAIDVVRAGHVVGGRDAVDLADLVGDVAALPTSVWMRM